jgi:ABC-type enterobactin transport system permease subunit
MSTRLALILTGVWTLAIIIASIAAISFVAAKVPRHQQEVRAQKLGTAVAVAASVGYGAIWLPWAWVRGRERRARR